MSKVQCRQCGQCCRNDGPLLHQDDRPLWESGALVWGHLLSLRVGELVHNPVRRKLEPLGEEAVKIGGTDEAQHPWHCVLHGETGCGLHPLRPAQCAALFCSDNSALESMYQERRATRKDVLAAAPEGWWALAEAHEEACPLLPLVQTAQVFFQEAPGSAAQGQAWQEILQSVRHDAAFRELCQSRARIPAAALPLILGRPLPIFLQSLGFIVRPAHLVPSAPPASSAPLSTASAALAGSSDLSSEDFVLVSASRGVYFQYIL